MHRLQGTFSKFYSHLAFLLLAESLLLVPNPKEYHWVSQGVTVVENMDDGEELQITDVSGPVQLANKRKSQDKPWGPACTATRTRVGVTQSSQAAAHIHSPPGDLWSHRWHLSQVCHSKN